jgi:hypothetical protein
VIGFVPVCADKPPPAIEVTLVKCAVPIPMSAHSLVLSPPPLLLTSEAVPVRVATVQVPFATNGAPMGTVPGLVAASAVLVPAHSFQVAAPEPTGLAVVSVALVQPPETANTAPVTLVVAVEVLSAIFMHTNALVGVGPSVSCVPMVAVIVCIAFDQCPPRTGMDVAVTTPNIQPAVSVQMTANALAPSTPIHNIAPV